MGIHKLMKIYICRGMSNAVAFIEVNELARFLPIKFLL
jgi:hypothetical protein